jgi:hypothetical protein
MSDRIYDQSMIDAFLTNFKLDPTAEKYHNYSFAEAFEKSDSGIANIIVPFDPNDSLTTDAFYVSKGWDFLHSVQHNYHKELRFDVQIGGQLVGSTVIPPNRIEYILGGKPLLLIHIHYSLVRFIICDDGQILHTNQGFQLTLYYGAIMDSEYRKFIAQNPPIDLRLRNVDKIE